MATRKELQALANLRLREAEALFSAGLYDGCAYLCGYVVEIALKARICAILGVNEYPEKGSRLKDAFRTHVFDDLKLLAGMEHEFSATRPVLLSNWSIASKWKPERRYDAPGSYDRAEAEEILNAIRAKPDGVLEWISSRWEPT
jgi:HEPN domain-containing protein